MDIHSTLSALAESDDPRAALLAEQMPNITMGALRWKNVCNGALCVEDLIQSAIAAVLSVASRTTNTKYLAGVARRAMIDELRRLSYRGRRRSENYVQFVEDEPSQNTAEVSLEVDRLRLRAIDPRAFMLAWETWAVGETLTEVAKHHGLSVPRASEVRSLLKERN